MPPEDENPASSGFASSGLKTREDASSADDPTRELYDSLQKTRHPQGKPPHIHVPEHADREASALEQLADFLKSPGGIALVFAAATAFIALIWLWLF